MKKKRAKRHIFFKKKDWRWQFIKFGLFLITGLSAVWLLQTGYPRQILDFVLPFKFIATFVVGLLYASYFTAPLSVVGLYVLANQVNPLWFALSAGFGSMLIDLIIVVFVRDVVETVEGDLPSPFVHKLKHTFKTFHLNFIALIIGILFVATPLPDEVGLVLLGASELPFYKIVALTFVVNTAGIFILLTAIRHFG